MTHTYTVMDEVEEPWTERRKTGETRLGLRYDQCAVLEAAYRRWMDRNATQP